MSINIAIVTLSWSFDFFYSQRNFYFTDVQINCYIIFKEFPRALEPPRIHFSRTFVNHTISLNFIISLNTERFSSVSFIVPVIKIIFHETFDRKICFRLWSRSGNKGDITTLHCIFRYRLSQYVKIKTKTEHRKYYSTNWSLVLNFFWSDLVPIALGDIWVEALSQAPFWYSTKFPTFYVFKKLLTDSLAYSRKIWN